MIQWITNENGLLIGVEDTVDVKQYETKGQKNEENNKSNRFARPCSPGVSCVFYTNMEPEKADGIRRICKGSDQPATGIK